MSIRSSDAGHRRDISASPETIGSVLDSRLEVSMATEAHQSVSVAGNDCLLCDHQRGDRELGRVEVWRDRIWRVTTSVIAPVSGFSYLEPLRHIPHITDLDGPEAADLGATLRRVTSALQVVTDAELIYVAVFGERNPHLHFNLAPHRAGDALTGGRGLADPAAIPPPGGEIDIAGTSGESFTGEASSPLAAVVLPP
jgi:diadenosine tetraphosphate (Ap4A) HIT family hydrolase